MSEEEKGLKGKKKKKREKTDIKRGDDKDQDIPKMYPSLKALTLKMMRQILRKRLFNTRETSIIQTGHTSPAHGIRIGW
jgi:hypothetical protein